MRSHGSAASGGFDAVIGNPPWDRIKLQEVEWFAERKPEIARAVRAADRKRLIQELRQHNDPLWQDYALATERAEANARVVRDCEDFPLLSGGDVNIYSLFVERAQALVHTQGIVGLLTPSGIAADKGASEFFRSISGTGRLAALYDFENRNNPGGSYFPDVDSRFKFCTLVFAGAARTFAASSCAFFLHDVAELKDAERRLALSAEDFKLVNPNTGSAPIFRNRRDAEITTRIYRNHPVLVDRSSGEEKKVWPVRYATMFHMTNDSQLFLNRAELEKQGWKPTPLNRWTMGEVVAVPLYVGKMIYHYDHRSANVEVSEENLKVATSSDLVSDAAKADVNFYPEPQYWVEDNGATGFLRDQWSLAFRDITNATNERTMVSAICPTRAVGNTLPLLLGAQRGEYTLFAPLLQANFSAMAFDFLARQKAQGTHLNWYIVEQLPVILPECFDDKIGEIKIADFVREEVLRLSYTAWDLAPFARDLGYVDEKGEVKPPFMWDEPDRRHRKARLDALFMRLYGLSKDDAGYILDTFPIVREQDERAFGDYRTKALVLAYMDMIEAGDLSRFFDESEIQHEGLATMHAIARPARPRQRTRR